MSHYSGSLKLGPIDVGFPVVQAALSGYSDWPMRRIAQQQGAPYTLCEVMLDQFLLAVRQRRKTHHFLYRTDDERPVGGQLMGAEPEQFALGARKLTDAAFDVIDINFGCPVKKVLGRCRGGFHLSQPPVAIEIMRRTRDAIPPDIPMTVKLRRGMDDSPESEDRFFTILDGAWASGAAAVTVHGRTVVQRYDGPSDWSFLRRVKEHAGSRTVLGSGDLFTPDDCLRMMRETGVDGVTVARGAIGNPWIFSRTRALARTGRLPPPPTVHQQRDVIRDHFDMAESIYGPRHAPQRMRKFGIKYAKLHPRHASVRDAMVKIRSRADFERVLHRWYAEDRPGVEPVVDETQ